MKSPSFCRRTVIQVSSGKGGSYHRDVSRGSTAHGQTRQRQVRVDVAAGQRRAGGTLAKVPCRESPLPQRRERPERSRRPRPGSRRVAVVKGEARRPDAEAAPGGLRGGDRGVERGAGVVDSERRRPLFRTRTPPTQGPAPPPRRPSAATADVGRPFPVPVRSAGQPRPRRDVRPFLDASPCGGDLRGGHRPEGVQVRRSARRESPADRPGTLEGPDGKGEPGSRRPGQVDRRPGREVPVRETGPGRCGRPVGRSVGLSRIPSRRIARFRRRRPPRLRAERAASVGLPDGPVAEGRERRDQPQLRQRPLRCGQDVRALVLAEGRDRRAAARPRRGRNADRASPRGDPSLFDRRGRAVLRGSEPEDEALHPAGPQHRGDPGRYRRSPA